MQIKKKADVFTKLWNLKESYLKYVGIGLYKDLELVSIYLNGDSIICHDTNEKNIELKRYLFHEDYYCSICSKDKETRFQNVKISDLIYMIELLE